MVKIKISGIPVELPFEPYPSQLVTISKLLECYQTNTNALIESPTGTGKSLSIICSALAYNEYLKRSEAGKNEPAKPVKIFICSRTHKQLDQLIDQLRKTQYKPRMTILGSRAQYCINSKIKDVLDKNKACSDLIKTQSCPFFNRKEKLIKNIGDRLFDLEELKVEGKRCTGCPYYGAKLLQADAEVVFCPYNYLIETSIRESCEIVLDNAIILIDEAHNFEDCCRTAGSVEITSKLLDIIIGEIVGGIKKSALRGTEIQTEFMNLMEMFRKLKEFSGVNEFDLKDFDSSSRLRKGQDIIKELEQIGITKERFIVFKTALQAILKHEEAKELLELNTARLLQEIERTVGMVLFTGTQSYAYCFKRSNVDNSFSYNFWLLDPSVMFLPLVSKIKSISLLSGTLTPFPSFSHELKYQFQHKLIAPHILKDEQVFVSIIKKGHLKRDLCGTYNVMETSEYIEQVAKIITDIANQVRSEGGTLVFVPSYAFLYKLQKKIKDAIIEPKEGGMAEFEKQRRAYQNNISLQKTAIFLCVYRGKAAEGIDFRDEFARAVVAIGIPYPSIKDPQIGLKKEFNDKNGAYSGKLWYEAQAFRAVNQALGRAIRHSKDWGSVFLLDSRYSDRRYSCSLSNWVTGNVKVYENYEQCVSEFKRFVQSRIENKLN